MHYLSLSNPIEVEDMLNLVLPKGSLEKNTLQLLEDADLTARRTNGRDYNLHIDDPRIGQVKALRPQEIPVYVARGYFDLGITGLDWIRETESEVVEVLDLGYNKQGIGRPVRIILAVADACSIGSGKDIPPGSRISTEYLQLTRKYFDGLGISVEILPSYGATEAKVPDIADAIVDVTETGTTLHRNGMRIVDVLLESSTKLIANPESFQDPEKRHQIGEICTLLDGVLSARGKVLIKLNVSSDNLEEVMSILPAAKAPTVSSLSDAGYYAVESVVPKSGINLLIPQLKAKGAEDILELPILKIVT